MTTIRDPMRASLREPYKHQIPWDVGKRELPCTIEINRISRSLEKVWIDIDDDHHIDATADLMNHPDVEEAVCHLNGLLAEMQ